MTDYSLNAKIREQIGKKNEELRDNDMIPAVMYGQREPINLVLEYNPFLKIYDEAGESSLIDLTIGDDKSVKVLVKDVQYHPVTNKVMHVDFKEIDMTKKIHTYIPLEFTGTSAAIKEQGGILVKSIDELEVECLPEDLIGEIEVDLSSLATFDDVIKIKDIKVPDGLELYNEPEDVVATVSEPRSEEELKSLEETPEADVESVEVAGKAEEEGEEEKKESEGEKKEEKPAEEKEEK